MAHWWDHTWHIVNADDRSRNELSYLDKPKEAGLPPPRTARIDEGSCNALGLPVYVCYKASIMTQLTSTPSQTAQVALSVCLGPAVRSTEISLFLISVLKPHKEQLGNGTGLVRPSGITHQLVYHGRSLIRIKLKTCSNFVLRTCKLQQLKSWPNLADFTGTTQTIPVPHFKFLFQNMLILKPSQRKHIQDFLT